MTALPHLLVAGVMIFAGILPGLAQTAQMPTQPALSTGDLGLLTLTKSCPGMC